MFPKRSIGLTAPNTQKFRENVAFQTRTREFAALVDRFTRSACRLRCSVAGASCPSPASKATVTPAVLRCYEIDSMIARIRKLTSLLYLLTVLAVACCHLPATLLHAKQAPAQVEAWDRVANSLSAVTQVSPSESTWRYTRFGWQDSSQWMAEANRIHPPRRRFDQLHPLTFALLIVLSVMTATLWASNEWEVARLIGASDNT